MSEVVEVLILALDEPREQVVLWFSRLYPGGVGEGPALQCKGGTMSAQKITRIVAIAVVASVASLIPGPNVGVASVSASARKGELHVTKECGDYHGAAGEFCTITSSNLTEIVNNSKVFYDQAAGIPTGLLDSNVVLDAGNGDRAVGRCTLDLETLLGLCTFSAGTGRFSGFEARVEVSYLGTGSDFAWDGTYSFTPQADR